MTKEMREFANRYPKIVRVAESAEKENWEEYSRVKNICTDILDDREEYDLMMDYLILTLRV